MLEHFSQCHNSPAWICGSPSPQCSVNQFWSCSKSCIVITCDQALSSFRSVKHSGGTGETKNRAWYNSSTEPLPPTQATIYLLGTSTQIYRIANLKVPLLYLVALSEMKLNENSEHDEVVMYRHVPNMLHAWILSFQVVYSLRVCHRFSAQKNSGN